MLGSFQEGSEVAILGNAGSARKSRNTIRHEIKFRALLVPNDLDGTFSEGPL